MSIVCIILYSVLFNLVWHIFNGEWIINEHGLIAAVFLPIFMTIGFIVALFLLYVVFKGI